MFAVDSAIVRVLDYFRTLASMKWVRLMTAGPLQTTHTHMPPSSLVLNPMHHTSLFGKCLANASMCLNNTGAFWIPLRVEGQSFKIRPYAY